MKGEVLPHKSGGKCVEAHEELEQRYRKILERYATEKARPVGPGHSAVVLAAGCGSWVRQLGATAKHR